MLTRKIHLEKKSGKEHPYRIIQTTGSVFKLIYGRASDTQSEVEVRFNSTKECGKMANNWLMWYKSFGYKEVAFTEGVPGVLYYFESQDGPGRVRIDGGANVYFPKGGIQFKSPKQGQRVLVHQIKKDPRLNVDFTFGSKYVATKLTSFPKTSSKIDKEITFSEVERKSLTQLYGSLMMGHEKHSQRLTKPYCGDFIFAFEKGVHRFLKFDKIPDVGKVVVYEPCFTSNFKSQSGWVTYCIPDFCAHIPRELSQKISKACE